MPRMRIRKRWKVTIQVHSLREIEITDVGIYRSATQETEQNGQQPAERSFQLVKRSILRGFKGRSPASYPANIRSTGCTACIPSTEAPAAIRELYLMLYCPIPTIFCSTKLDSPSKKLARSTDLPCNSLQTSNSNSARSGPPKRRKTSRAGRSAKAEMSARVYGLPPTCRSEIQAILSFGNSQ